MKSQVQPAVTKRALVDMVSHDIQRQGLMGRRYLLPTGSVFVRSVPLRPEFGLSFPARATSASDHSPQVQGRQGVIHWVLRQSEDDMAERLIGRNGPLGPVVIKCFVEQGVNLARVQALKILFCLLLW